MYSIVLVSSSVVTTFILSDGDFKFLICNYKSLTMKYKYSILKYPPNYQYYPNKQIL